MKLITPILLLLISFSARSAVIYTDITDRTVTDNSQVHTILIGDEFMQFTGYFGDNFFVRIEANSQMMVPVNQWGDATSHNSGETIGPSGAWDGFGAYMNGTTYEFQTYTDKFLAFRMNAGGGQYKYGWIRVQFTQTSMIIKDHAYENVPGTPITISVPAPVVYYVQILPAAASTSVNAGSTLQLQAMVHPNGVLTSNVEWSITNGPGEATLSAGGLLTGVSPGYVVVTADPNFAASPVSKAILVKPGIVDIEEENEVSVSIYPNPAANELILSGQTQPLLLEILDPEGKLCASWNLQPDTGILDISTLSSGVYWIRITDENGKISNQKLVKQ